MQITKTLAAVALAAPLTFGLLACDPPQSPNPTAPTETEDCDAEDLLNLEDDCGFTGATTTTQKAKATTTTKKATPRTTPRTTTKKTT